jgi:hypothetical protein
LLSNKIWILKLNKTPACSGIRTGPSWQNT